MKFHSPVVPECYLPTNKCSSRNVSMPDTYLPFCLTSANQQLAKTFLFSDWWETRMTKVLAQSENELAAFLLLLLPGSLTKRDEPRLCRVFQEHRIGGSKTTQALRSCVTSGNWLYLSEPTFSPASLGLVIMYASQNSLEYSIMWNNVFKVHRQAP